MNENLKKKFFHYILPTILSMLAFSLYTMVDGMFVAKGVGEQALAAVNLSAPYNSAMFACGLLLAVGMGTVIAVGMGEGNLQTCNQLFTQNLLVAVGTSLLISVLTLLFLEPLALFLGATEATLPYVKEYIGVIAPFAAFFLCAYQMEILVKTDGTPQLAAIGVILAGLTNVFLDWLFVMVFGWGVKGAAFATGLAQAASACLYICYFWKKSRYLKFVQFSWNIRIYRKTIPLGFADGITELSNGIVLFLFNQAVLKLLGEKGIVSYTIVGYVNTFMLMMMSGIAQGMQPLCSFYYGKREPESSRYLLRLGLISGVVLGAAGWLVCMGLGGEIVKLFLSQESPLYQPSVTALRKYSWGFLVMAFPVILAAFFTATQKAAGAFAISIGRGLIFPAAAVILVPLWFGSENIWYAGGAAEAASVLLAGGLTAAWENGSRRRETRDECVNQLF